MQVDDNNTGQTVFHVGIMLRQTLIKTIIHHFQYSSLPFIPLIECLLRQCFFLFLDSMGCLYSSALGLVGRKSARGANLFSPPKQWINDMYGPIWRVIDGKWEEEPEGLGQVLFC